MFTLAVSSLIVASASAAPVDDAIAKLNQRKNDPETFVETLRNSEFAAISPEFKKTGAKSSVASSDSLPLVFLHGMGDSCFNRGMESITEEAGEYMGVYSTCIPTGDTKSDDTMNCIEHKIDAKTKSYILYKI